MAFSVLSGQFQSCPMPTKDLTGQTIIITGANSGLGLDAAKHLYRLKCSHIILACRDLGRGETAKQDIVQTGPAQKVGQTISVWQLDMASYASVSSFAARAAADLPRLDGAVLNAGVSLTEFTLAEGLETTLTVNVASTFLLAILLVPLLRQTSDATGSPTHLTIVGSSVHAIAKHEQLVAAAAASPPSTPQILKNLSDPNTAKMGDRYFLSKLPVVLLSAHLARLLTASSSRIILNCINPGYCRTGLFRHDETLGSRMALRVIGRSSEEGSRTLVHAVAEAGEDTHGQFVGECRVKKPSAFVRSAEGEKMKKLLWEEIVRIVEGVKPGCIAKI